MPRSLRLRADLYDSATGNFPVQILLERAGELVERNRPAHDARQVPRGEIGGDSPPDLESLRARSRGRIDSEKVHAAQNEWHDGGLEIGAAGEPHACDVSPEIDLAGQPGEDVTADAVDGAAITRRLERAAAQLEFGARHDLASA